ncbi:DNA integrity scanning protein DisA nucleotide-binding domain protein [Candidatus Woesearchaeota archaeon]|nr:DNA integrity scanning protein DisA nucleotide-binding domain protein [Candidatus Woesearchaeota archaeon]
MKKHDVYEFIISISKEISKKREGALFVIANTKRLNNKYSLLFPQIQKKFYISEKGSEKIIEKLATLDGAVLISDSGMLLAYGAKLKRSIPVRGHGTKHAAAAGTTSSIKEATAILVSEEDSLIKIFQHGKIILEMDSYENPKSLEDKIIAFISEGDTALLTAAGVSTVFLGSAAIAPLAIVGGTYLAIRTAGGIIKRNWESLVKKKH